MKRLAHAARVVLVGMAINLAGGAGPASADNHNHEVCHPRSECVRGQVGAPRKHCRRVQRPRVGYDTAWDLAHGHDLLLRALAPSSRERGCGTTWDLTHVRDLTRKFWLQEAFVHESFGRCKLSGTCRALGLVDAEFEVCRPPKGG